MKSNLTLQDCEKITDTLMHLGDGITLRFNVLLFNNTKDGNRDYYYKEFEYSKKGKQALSISRRLNYFFTINVPNDFKNSIMIRPVHMMQLIDMLQSLRDAIYAGEIFKYNEEKGILEVSMNEEMEAMCTMYLTNTEFIKFEPYIITYENGETSTFIHMVINNNLYIDLPLNTFEEFIYMLSIDMHLTACNMINFLGAPPLGTNRTTFEQNDNSYVDDIPFKEAKATSESYFLKMAKKNMNK